MHIDNRALVLDLVEWVAAGPRPYDETIEAWRTSCPRLPIWEDALEHGLIARAYGDRGAMVVATAAGLELLAGERPARSVMDAR